MMKSDRSSTVNDCRGLAMLNPYGCGKILRLMYRFSVVIENRERSYFRYLLL